MFTFDMFFDFGELDWLGIIVATIVMAVLGAIWWGPLFGKQWAAAHGMEYEPQPPPQKVAITVAYTLAFNIGLAYFAVDDFEHAVVAALIFGVLLILPVMYSAVVWARQPVNAFVIDAVYWIVAVFLAMFIQGLFV